MEDSDEEDPLLGGGLGGGFSKMLETAAKMKEAEMKQDRKRYDALPSYVQHTIFHKEDITKWRDSTLALQDRLVAADKIKDEVATYI